MCSKAHKIWLCVDRFDAPDGKVWAVRDGRRWCSARTVKIDIVMETIFRGKEAMQPKAYLMGVGVVHDDGHGVLTIART